MFSNIWDVLVVKLEDMILGIWDRKLLLGCILVLLFFFFFSDIFVYLFVYCIYVYFILYGVIIFLYYIFFVYVKVYLLVKSFKKYNKRIERKKIYFLLVIV